MICTLGLCQSNETPLGRQITYKVVDGFPLSLYVNEPKTHVPGPRAAVLFFNGGGWISGGPNQFNFQSTAIVGRGAVAIEVQYRQLKKGENVPPRVCVEDAKSAVRWVRSHATDLNIDPDRIAAVGGSAGGYLAAYAAMVPGWDAPADPLDVSPAPNALVLLNPVLDNSPTGFAYGRFGEDYKNRSPLFFVNSNTPPTLILSGSTDKLIQPTVLHDFQARMLADGVRCELVIYDGQSHAFFNRSPFLEQTTEQMVRFLDSLGYFH